MRDDSVCVRSPLWKRTSKSLLFAGVLAPSGASRSERWAPDKHADIIVVTAWASARRYSSDSRERRCVAAAVASPAQTFTTLVNFGRKHRSEDKYKSSSNSGSLSRILHNSRKAIGYSITLANRTPNGSPVTQSGADNSTHRRNLSPLLQPANRQPISPPHPGFFKTML